MSHGRDRSRRPARRAPFRNPERSILVVCEGKCTEKEYLDQFARAQRKHLVAVRVVPDAGVPITVIEEAQRLRAKARDDAKRVSDPFLEYDEVWCAIDVDEHPHLNDAIETARQSGLHVAVSNPCFELWLVLHHREPPGMIHRHDLQSMVKTFVPNYDKHVSYDHYGDGYYYCEI